MRIRRAYADTSVFGGCFDEEFESPSRAFFAEVAAGRFRLHTAALVRAEMEGAPAEVRRFFQSQLPSAELVEVSEQALVL